MKNIFKKLIKAYTDCIRPKNFFTQLKEGSKARAWTTSGIDLCLFYKKRLMFVVNVDHCIFFRMTEKAINESIQELKKAKLITFGLDNEENVVSFL